MFVFIPASLRHVSEATQEDTLLRLLRLKIMAGAVAVMYVNLPTSKSVMEMQLVFNNRRVNDRSSIVLQRFISYSYKTAPLWRK